MLSIFKKNPAAPSGSDNVGDYYFKKHYPDVNRQMSWSDLEPYIRQATRSYVLPYIGETLYNDLATKIQAGTVLTTDQEQLVEHLRDVVAYYSVMVALGKKKTVVASMGAVENKDKENTTGSSLWGFKTTLWSVAQDADRQLDELLNWMENKVDVAPANAFSTYLTDNWKSKPEYDAGANGLFRQPRDFHAFHHIGQSLRTFRALLPTMDECAQQYILPILCQDQYDALVAQTKANSLTADNKKLLELTRRALAKWTVFHAARSLTILVEHDGFRVVSYTDAVDQRAYSSDVIRGAIEGLKEQAHFSARNATAALTDWLYLNPDKYPFWRDSACNKAGADGEICVFAPGAGGVFI